MTASELLLRLWPEERSRPSLRWLRQQQHNRSIPFIKVGGRVFFCPAHVLMYTGSKLTLFPKRASCGPGKLPAPDLLIDAVGLIEFMVREYGLKRSLRWVRQQQEDRTLPYLRWGRKVFFSPAQIKAALQTH